MEQRSDEWKKFRRPRITASRFGDVLADPKTKRYQEYKQDIIDAIIGVPDFEEEKPWFEHGKRMEPEGLGMYEWERNVEIENVGTLIHPKYDFISGSPDGLIGDLGGVELKCHVSLNEFIKAHKSGIPSHYRPQVMGYLWITGRKWWDYCSYYRNGTKSLIHVHCIYPDGKYFKRLEKSCLKMWEEINKEVLNH